MEVSKINGLSEINFTGRKHRHPKKSDSVSYPQMDAPASKQAANGMKYLLYGTMAVGATGAMVGCKDKHDVIDDLIEYALKPSYYRPIDNGIITDDTYINFNDTNIVAKTEYYKDTIFTKQVDSITGEVTYIPEIVTKKRDVNDTIINQTGTTVTSSFKPINLKEAAFEISDSLIDQGMTLGIPVVGPTSQTSSKNKILLIGAKAYNETNHKLYETQIDSAETSDAILTFYTKITDFDEKDPAKQVSYMKTMAFDMNGQGIRLERFVKGENKDKNCNCADVPDWAWNSAGGETRMNNHDGSVRVLVTDKYGQPLNGEYGKIVKGNDLGSFLFGSYMYENNGNPCYDCSKGAPVKVDYQFSQAKLYTTEVEPVKVKTK